MVWSRYLRYTLVVVSHDAEKDNVQEKCTQDVKSLKVHVLCSNYRTFGVVEIVLTLIINLLSLLPLL